MPTLALVGETMESNLQPPDPRERRRQRDRDRYAQMSDQKKGEVLKKRREVHQQKTAAASLAILNYCTSTTFQDNEMDTEQPVSPNLQDMSNTDMPGQKSIVDCVQTLNYSATGIYWCSMSR